MEEKYKKAEDNYIIKNKLLLRTTWFAWKLNYQYNRV